MSRRRGDNQVRGPNSALTEFLRSQGINANEIRRRHNEREVRHRERQDEEIDEEQQAEVEEEEQIRRELGEEAEEIIKVARRKRRRGRGVDDEEEEEDEEDEDFVDDQAETSSVPTRRSTRSRRRLENRSENENEDDLALDGMDLCAKCNCRFTITVYTVQNEEGKNLCRNCSSTLKTKKSVDATQLAIRRQRKKIAAALLDGKDLMNVPSLQDQCIKIIVKYIDDVEALGDIGTVNLNKISRIVTRNRRLTPLTLKLFLDSSKTKLELWDCSSLTADSINLIGSYCPNLETLSLGMCGQLTNENLKYFITNLPNLKNLYLDGPFLINKDNWISFFSEIGERLHQFHVKSTHRIDDEVIANIVTCCPNLTHLTLNRLPALKGDASIHMLAELGKLEYLDLSYLGEDFNLYGLGSINKLNEGEDLVEDNEDGGDVVDGGAAPTDTPEIPNSGNDDIVVSDDSMLTILNQVGSQLRTLIVDGSCGLSDKFINEGIRPCCGSLNILSLCLLDQLTNESIEKLFTNWKINEGLVKLSLKRCIGVSDSAVKAIMKHSKKTIVELDLNSLQLVTKESLAYLYSCPNLTTLDLGFVRATDDSVIESLDKSCPNLKSIEVYGDTRVTAACRISPGRKLIGRQSDTI